jgi:hypothetical protein
VGAAEDDRGMTRNHHHSLAFLHDARLWPQETDAQRAARAGSEGAARAFADWRPHSNSDTAADQDVKTATKNPVAPEEHPTRPDAAPTSTDLGTWP